MTDSNKTIELTGEELIMRSIERIEKNQGLLHDRCVNIHRLLTIISTPKFQIPDEKERDLTPNLTGILKQITKDRENLARKTVVLEKIQNVLDAHYGWENENGIDD